MFVTHYLDLDLLKSTGHQHISSKNQIITKNKAPSKSSTDTIHTMYSVGCDHMHMWQLQQSVTLDNSWYKHQQPGHLTRIVSGCNFATNNIRRMSTTSIPITPDIHFLDNADLVQQCLNLKNTSTASDHVSETHKHKIFPLKWDKNERFHIIFLPSFDDIKKNYPFVFGSEMSSKSYAQLNRILGLFIIYHCTDYQEIIGDYMMMLDPDFVFLKSLEINTLQTEFKLALNQPVAGKYGLGDKWVKWLKDAEPSRSVFVSAADSRMYYEAGVPYILHNTDWYNIIPTWMDYIAFAYAKYDGIESDMYAYMMASYKLGLKHTLSDKFQVTCMKSMDQAIHPLDDKVHFLHYCSSYKVDISRFKEFSEKFVDKVFTFNKHWTKARRNRDTKEQQLWMIECESPVMIEVPVIDEFENYDDVKAKDGKYRNDYKQYKIVRNMVPLFNEALIAWKEKNCENKTLINREKKIITHEATLQNGDILFHIVSDM